MAKELVRVWKCMGFVLKIYQNTDTDGRRFGETELSDGNLLVEGLMYYPLDNDPEHDFGSDSDVLSTIQIAVEHNGSGQTPTNGEGSEPEFTQEQLDWLKGPRRYELLQIANEWQNRLNRAHSTS